MVTLTVDRQKFPDGKIAHEEIQRSGAISEWIKALKRHGVRINDYRWVLEWHSDGFPHWHDVIEVAEAGSAGRIGVDLIRRYWTFGRWIYESPVESEKHWKAIYGYVGGHGYFKSKEKGHQSTLPEWALDSGRTIKRTSPARKNKAKSQSQDNPNKEVLEIMYEKIDSNTWLDPHTGELVNKYLKPKRAREPVNYRLKLGECGSRSVVFGDLPDGTTLQIETDIPYQDLKARMGGEYDPLQKWVVGFATGNLWREIIDKRITILHYKTRADRQRMIGKLLREAWYSVEAERPQYWNGAYLQQD